MDASKEIRNDSENPFDRFEHSLHLAVNKLADVIHTFLNVVNEE